MTKPKAAKVGGKCLCCGLALKRHKSHLVFDEYGKFRKIQFLLSECVNKVVNEVPGSQQSICTDCLNQLDQNYAFKLKCSSSAKAESGAAMDSNEDETDEEPSSESEYEIDVDVAELDSKDDESDEPNFEGESKIDADDCRKMEAQQDVQLCVKVEQVLVDPVERSEHVKEESTDIIDQTNQNEDSINSEIYEYEAEMLDIEKKEILLLDEEHTNMSEESNTELITVNLDQSPEYEDSNEAVEYVEYLDTDSQQRQQPPPSPSSEVPFIETLTLQSIRIKIRERIPIHSKPAMDDVDELYTDPPQLQIEPVVSDDYDPIDMDDYLRTIVTVSFCELTPFIVNVVCTICDESIANYANLMQHTINAHNHQPDDDSLSCCLGGQHCSTTPFADRAELNNHHFLEHSDLINAHAFLTCATCEMVTESLVKFGKHICSSVKSLAEPQVDNKYKCMTCFAKFRSRKRSIFHQQFHLPNSRPKVCLVCDTVYSDEHSFYEHVMFAHEEFFQYSCRHCDKTFTIESELRRHEHSHTAIRSFVCTECDKAFFDQQTLTTHNLIHLPGFTCEYCQKHFNRKSRLRKHMIITHINHTPAVLSVCQQCGQTFTEDKSANRHWTKEHSNVDDTPKITHENLEMVYCCEFCELEFVDIEQLSEHKICHNDVELKFQCQYCPAKYKEYGRLKNHANSHADIKKPYPVKRMYVCEVEDCFKPYADWRNFQNHRKTVHLINPSIFRCEQCDTVFYKSWTYAYHMKSVHNEHMQCPYCEQTFVLKRSLEVHIQRKHVNVASDVMKQQRRSKHDEFMSKYFAIAVDGQFECLECEKHIKNRSNAIAHVRMMHLNIRDFKCEVCSKTFFHRGDLNTHMRLHNLETPYQCSYCDHSTRSKSMLNLHVRKHTNERPYKCDQCPKSFKRALVLKNHKQLHGEKELKCDQCDMTFYTKATLQIHCKNKHDPDAGSGSGSNTLPSKSKRPKERHPSTIYVMYGSTLETNQNDKPSKRPDKLQVYLLPNNRIMKISNNDDESNS